MPVCCCFLEWRRLTSVDHVQKLQHSVVPMVAIAPHTYIYDVYFRFPTTIPAVLQYMSPGQGVVSILQIQVASDPSVPSNSRAPFNIFQILLLHWLHVPAESALFRGEFQVFNNAQRQERDVFSFLEATTVEHSHRILWYTLQGPSSHCECTPGKYLLTDFRDMFESLYIILNMTCCILSLDEAENESSAYILSPSQVPVRRNVIPS